MGVVVPLRAGLWARVGAGGAPPKLDILLFGAVVVSVLGLFRGGSARSADTRRWRFVDAAWARVTWLCELFGRAKTTLCACEAAAPKFEGEASS